MFFFGCQPLIRAFRANALALPVPCGPYRVDYALWSHGWQGKPLRRAGDQLRGALLGVAYADVTWASDTGASTWSDARVDPDERAGAGAAQRLLRHEEQG